jgi:hypothetical protein
MNSLIFFLALLAVISIGIVTPIVCRYLFRFVMWLFRGAVPKNRAGGAIGSKRRLFR